MTAAESAAFAAQQAAAEDEASATLARSFEGVFGGGWFESLAIFMIIHPYQFIGIVFAILTPLFCLGGFAAKGMLDDIDEVRSPRPMHRSGSMRRVKLLTPPSYAMWYCVALCIFVSAQKERRDKRDARRREEAQAAKQRGAAARVAGIGGKAGGRGRKRR